MENNIKEQILLKNKKLINMVIERAKRDFPEDIAIIGLTGSFSTGDFHEKSDLDLIIINNTPDGWGISYGFILEDVGYDIYCTPWETRIQEQANLESPMVACLIDLQILYCAKPEYMDKLNQFKQKAMDEFAKPIGKNCIERAKKHIDFAKQEYAQAMLADELGLVRAAAGETLYHVINAVVNLNNTCIKRGVKRYMEELLSYEYLPEDFETLYYAVIDAQTIVELRDTSLQLLKSLEHLYHKMKAQFIETPIPTYDNLAGTYEELWCNCRNKVIASVDANDKNYAFHAALSAQDYLDEMSEIIGTPQFDLLSSFDSNNLALFKEAFLNSMDEYKKQYDKVGREVERFDTFEQLYGKYMNL